MEVAATARPRRGLARTRAVHRRPQAGDPVHPRPCAAAAATGRARQAVIEAADLAVVTHHGSHDGIDRAYGRTEIAWPILRMAD